MISSPSSSCCEVGSLYTTSAIVGFGIVGPGWPRTICCHASSAAYAASCKIRCAVRFSLSSKGVQEAVEVASIRLTKRDPTIVASRIMSRIHGLAAIRASKCARRATSTDPLAPDSFLTGLR